VEGGEGEKRMAGRRSGGLLRRHPVSVVLVVIAAVLIFVWQRDQPRPGHVLDEAKLANRTAESFAAAADDYFKAMDGGDKVTSADEMAGRNMWLLWTGGNDRFWDEITKISFGNFDLLKILSSYPGLKYGRDTRWHYLGLVNEPCFEKATQPNAERFGLWLDVRRAGCTADPFEDEAKYKGVEIGARGKTQPVGSYYGYASGIVGLRLFPNPDFDEAAQRKWDAVRYYTDPSYYNSKDLVRPYRVGMACGFCHVGPNPVAPPADPENPDWANLSSTVGAQFFWVDRIFTWQADPRSFFFQLFHTARPGSLDTSLVSTDYINNPRTMNAVYELLPRLGVALDRGRETLSGGELDNKQFNDFFKEKPFTEFFKPPATVWTPHVLKDGADSVGALGALNRVYLNIGLFSEEWLLHFNAFVGGITPSPIEIKAARENSVYWQATEAQTKNMALFLLKAGYPHKLADAPGGSDYLKDSEETLGRGKEVFAERCARCHSSKYPPPPADANPANCAGPQYLDCWSRYWTWTKTDGFKTAMRALVSAPDFLTGNFLSNDMRVPVSLLRTNLCSPLATNALADNIWDNFSSQSYKDLPSVGDVTIYDPLTGAPKTYRMPAGGRGYTRPASLVSLWATAPYLLNNSVGHFEPEPSVAARMRAFDDGIHQMLWPERRERDSKLGNKVPGTIDRVTEPSYLRIPAGFLPDVVQAVLKPLSAVVPSLFTSGVRTVSFTATTKFKSAELEEVNIARPDILTTFAAGAAVSGPGLPADAHVVRFDAAAARLTIDSVATADGKGAQMRVDVPDAGVSIGPIPQGMPVDIIATLELTPDSHDLLGRVEHDIKLLRLLLDVKRAAAGLAPGSSEAEQTRAYETIQNELYTMSKCPDFVVNRGHYFGTDQFDEEPGLSDQDKEALIAFLKTF
jgi:hypothetical protein